MIGKKLGFEYTVGTQKIFDNFNFNYDITKNEINREEYSTQIKSLLEELISKQYKPELIDLKEKDLCEIKIGEHKIWTTTYLGEFNEDATPKFNTLPIILQLKRKNELTEKLKIYVMETKENVLKYLDNSESRENMEMMYKHFDLIHLKDLIESINDFEDEYNLVIDLKSKELEEKYNSQIRVLNEHYLLGKNVEINNLLDEVEKIYQENLS